MEPPEGIHVLRVPAPYKPLGSSLAYVIASPEGHTMIDTGWDWSDGYESMVDQLEDIGLDVKDVRQIILTHIHRDHAGLAGRIREVSGAKVITHRRDTPAARDEEGFVDPPLASHGVPSHVSLNSPLASERYAEFDWPEPDETLEGGEMVRAGSRQLEVIWTPGHSYGHICLYDRPNKLLFSGDLVLPVITSHVGLLWDSLPGSDPLGDFMSSLAKLRPLEVETILPAHKYIFDGLHDRLQEIDRHHKERLQEVREAIVGDWGTAFDIAGKVTWAIGAFDLLEDDQKLMATGATLAHLEYLYQRGELAKKHEAGVIFYGGRGC